MGMLSLDELENVSLRDVAVRSRHWSVPMLMTKLTSPKKVLGMIGAGITLLTLSRVMVLVIESYSTVAAERAADKPLMSMCNSGHGIESADLRALCMKKRAEQAAPILLKALLRACATAFSDFCESMSSPTKVVMLVLFAITGIAAPVVKAVASLCVDHLRTRRRRRVVDDDSGSDDDEGGAHEIVVVGPGPATRSRSMSTRLRRSARHLGIGRSHSYSAVSAPQLLLEEDD